MLEVAREKARRARSSASLEFTRGDVTNLPFDDESFDIVSIAFGLRNVDRPDRALAEMRRVLRAKTGRLLILEFSRPKNRVVRAINSLYCGRIMPFTASIIAGDRSGAYRYLPKSIDAFPGGEALAQMVREAGFASTTTHPLTFGVCTITIGRVR
jgi:demethylmenaquinone methyltransferase/2-methoxy-6-polyprenyl-1,4-benzoquinol methylase